MLRCARRGQLVDAVDDDGCARKMDDMKMEMENRESRMEMEQASEPMLRTRRAIGDDVTHTAPLPASRNWQLAT